ncbi:MAG: hypothetical protein RRB13_05660 [bacterium]|nr:hypothetical protein [bacterium]
METSRISIVIPVYQGATAPPQEQRETWLRLFQAAPKSICWHLVESYRSGEGLQIIPWLAQYPQANLRLHPLPLERPQRAAAFNFGIAQTQTKLVALIHQDCLPDLAGLTMLAESEEWAWGGFNKCYEPSHWMLKLSSLYQNQVRFPRGLLVGTNGFVFPRSFWERHPFRGDFLEDLGFSDQIQKELGRPKSFGILRVSSTRYHRRGVARCLLENSLILLGYRLGLSPRFLRQFYRPMKEPC